MRTSFIMAALAAVSLIAASPAISQSFPDDGIEQYQVRIVDVPRSAAVEAFTESGINGDTHSVESDFIRPLVDSTDARQVVSFGSSTSREISIREDNEAIEFKLAARQDPEGGILIDYVSALREGDLEREGNGSGILVPGRVLVHVTDGDDPELSRLTILSIN